MHKSRHVGLRVVTVFSHRGIKCYIRSRGTVLEQLLVSKPFFFSDMQLHTHYYEYKSIRRGQPYQEEEIRAVQAVHDLVRMTADEILTQRTFKVEVAAWCKRLFHNVQQASRLSLQRFQGGWATFRAALGLPAWHEKGAGERKPIAE